VVAQLDRIDAFASFVAALSQRLACPGVPYRRRRSAAQSGICHDRACAPAAWRPRGFPCRARGRTWMTATETAIVVGVGAEAGLGARLCARFGREGLHVLVAGRSAARIEDVAERIRSAGGAATAVPTDTTREADVLRLFERADALAPGRLALTAYNAGNNAMKDFLDMDAAFFEDTWRVACFGGFLVGREAARRMVAQARGTLLFTGASASLRGRPPFGAFASAKAGLRAIAQTMARAYGPRGVHVAHVVIDGGIAGERLQRLPQLVAAKGEDGLLDLDAIADTFWMLHGQHRTAWTHELDVRPFKEPF
jgi:NAD(P)-dependent dehydrogenase (short-subunit alcohol dehydrogenase family)